MSWRDTLRKQDEIKKQEQDRILKQAQDMLSQEITEDMSAMQRDAHNEMKRLTDKAMTMPDGPAKNRLFDRVKKLIEDLQGPVGSSKL